MWFATADDGFVLRFGRALGVFVFEDGGVSRVGVDAGELSGEEDDVVVGGAIEVADAEVWFFPVDSVFAFGVAAV